jgi:hypothetical protein
MLNDADRRGIVLQKYYEKLLEGFVEISEFDFNELISKQEIVHISEQLASYDLIAWQPSYDQDIGGIGKIRSIGIDVVLRGGIESPIEIKIDKNHHSLILHDIGIDLYKLLYAIEHSNTSEKEIQDAKAKLTEFLNLPPIKKYMGNSPFTTRIQA